MSDFLRLERKGPVETQSKLRADKDVVIAYGAVLGEVAKITKAGRQAMRIKNFGLDNKAGIIRWMEEGGSLNGDLVAIRFANWKAVFMEQRAPGTLRVWAEPFTPLRVPKLYDLRADPYEQADVTSNTYYEWLMEQGYILFAASMATAEFLETFKDFPPSQRAASFTIDQAMEKLRQNLGAQ